MNLDEVNYEFKTKQGYTIFQSCFHLYACAAKSLNSHRAETMNHIQKTFSYLVENAKQKNFELDDIIKTSTETLNSLRKNLDKALNAEAVYCITKNGIPVANDDQSHEKIREIGLCGFAEYYLKGRRNQKRQPDHDVFQKLLTIDSQFGTTQSEQLLACLHNTTRLDLISVCGLILKMQKILP